MNKTAVDHLSFFIIRYTIKEIIIAKSSAVFRVKSAIWVELIPNRKPSPITKGLGALIIIAHINVFLPDLNLAMVTDNYSPFIFLLIYYSK